MLAQVQSEGVKTLVHGVDAEVQLDGASAVAGSGPAIFLAAGRARVHGLTVRGHEYALQLGRGADVEVEGLTVAGTAQACVTAVQAKLALRRAELTACGLSGAVVLLESTTVVSQLNVSKTPELGILARRGTLTLTQSTLAFITVEGEALGDAVHVRDAIATIDGVRVSDVDGTGLFVGAVAEVQVGSLEVERARHSALFVERGSQVTIEKLLVRGGGGPAVLVPDGARVRLHSLSVAGGNDVPIYAECRAGAVVELGRIESTVPQLPSACITPLSR